MEVTLKDIARECNVSFSTVSKALKNSSEISQKTIDLVNKTAKRMGYHTNAAARALRTNKTYSLGVIFEDITGSGLQHQYFATIFDSINVHANKAGYNITFLSHNSSQSYLAQAKYRRCDGVIIVSTNFYREDIQTLIESNIPMSMLDYKDNYNHSSVMSDNRTGIRLITENIIQNGHKKIAFIHGEESDVTKLRMTSFRQTMKKNNVEICSDYIKEAIYHDPEASFKATEMLIQEKDQPTCIIYPDDFAALGGIQALAKHGLMPGKNISIAGYDGILISSLLTPKLTTYQQDAKELGKQLVAQLLTNIEYPETFKAETVKVTGHLLSGASIVNLNNKQ
ncbi:MAG: LacI family transcriptional regulator [Treponema sp.]|nr:LacI family transcriptional regulator [Treponema sp.]